MNLSVCASFPSCFEGGMWDLIISIPDHCLSIYFALCDCLSNIRFDFSNSISAFLFCFFFLVVFFFFHQIIN